MTAVSPATENIAPQSFPAPAGQPAHAPKRFYRPELDVIRFLAFLTVFLHHALFNPDVAATSVRGAIVMSCGFGLCLFFTLSAYLITTLLLRERARIGTVDLPSFYIRRMLRIWPLYLLALFVSMAIELHRHTLALNRNWYIGAFVMLGNVIAISKVSVYVGQLWSISIEEQFYLVWPGLMQRLSRRHLAIAAIIILFISNATLAYFGHIHADTWQRVWWNSFVQMEMFAAGILLALRHDLHAPAAHSWLIRILGFLAVPAAWFLATSVFHAKGFQLPARGPVSLCIGFALVAASCALLIEVATGLHRWPGFLLYLGKISYGLYVFHVAALRFAVHAHQGIVLGFILTVIAAALSYKFIESPFLHWKEKYAIVPSRPVN